MLTMLPVLLAAASSCSGEHNEAAELRRPTTPTSPTSFRGDDSAGDLDPGERQDRIVAQTRAHEELIAGCMREQGFTWEPGFLAAALERVAASRTDPNQFRRDYGFGISTRIGVQEARGSMGDLPTDPNADRRAGLDDASRAAYDAAFEQCLTRHRDAAPWMATDEPDDDAASLHRRVATDPRTIAAAAQWSACMGRAGFHYSNRDELQADLETRAAPFLDAYTRAAAGRAGENAPTVDALLDAARLAELRDLQREELAAAAADASCAAPYDAVYSTVYAELRDQEANEG